MDKYCTAYSVRNTIYEVYTVNNSKYKNEKAQMCGNVFVEWMATVKCVKTLLSSFSV